MGRLDENLAATGIELSADDLSELDDASASVRVRGDRHPEAMQQMADR